MIPAEGRVISITLGTDPRKIRIDTNAGVGNWSCPRVMNFIEASSDETKHTAAISRRRRSRGVVRMRAQNHPVRPDQVLPSPGTIHID